MTFADFGAQILGPQTLSVRPTDWSLPGIAHSETIVNVITYGTTVYGLASGDPTACVGGLVLSTLFSVCCAPALGDRKTPFERSLFARAALAAGLTATGLIALVAGAPNTVVEVAALIALAPVVLGSLRDTIRLR